MENTSKSLRFFRMPKRQSESLLNTNPLDVRNEIVGQSTCNYSVTTSDVKMAAEIGSDAQDLEDDDNLQQNIVIEPIEISKTEKSLQTLGQWEAGSLGEKVDLLISVWTTLTAESQHLPNVTQLFDSVFGHTIQTILSEEWPTLGPLRHKQMARALTLCSQALGPLVDHAPRMCATLLMAVYDPWPEPIMRVITDEDGINDQNVQQFLASEPPELVLARIQSLAKAGKHESAFRLCKCYLRLTSNAGDSTLLSYEHDSVGGTGSEEHRQKMLHFTEWLVRLLYAKNNLREIVTETANCTCHEGVQLIRRIRDGDSEDSIGLAETLTHLFLVRDLLYPSMYCCTKELMMMWCSLQVVQSRSLEEVYFAARKLVVLHASTSAHFYLFVDVLWEEFGKLLFPLYLEMYVRGLTADLNHLEVAKQEGSTDTILEMENHIASVYTKLGSLFSPGQEVFARECVLSAFSVEPTPERLHLLQYLTCAIVGKGRGNPLVGPNDDVRNPGEPFVVQVTEEPEDDAVEETLQNIVSSVVASQDDVSLHETNNTEVEWQEVAPKPAIEESISFQNAFMLSIQGKSLPKELDNDIESELNRTGESIILPEDCALKETHGAKDLEDQELKTANGPMDLECRELNAINNSVDLGECEFKCTRVLERESLPENQEPMDVDTREDLDDAVKSCIHDLTMSVDSKQENTIDESESEEVAMSQESKVDALKDNEMQDPLEYEKDPKIGDPEEASESKVLDTEMIDYENDIIVNDLEKEIVPKVIPPSEECNGHLQKKKCNCSGRCSTPIEDEEQKAPIDKSAPDNFVFFHPLLDAPIDGIHLDLIKDLVIVLESTRHNLLKCSDDWEKMRAQCQDYMETMAALRLMLQHSLGYDSADSETDSASEDDCFPMHHHGAQRISRQNSCDSPFDDSDMEQMSVQSQGFICCDKAKTAEKHAREHVCRGAAGAKQKSKLLRYFNEHSLACRESKKRRRKKKRKSRKEKDRDLTIRRVLFDGIVEDDGRNLKKKRKRPYKKGKEKLNSGIDINTVDLSSIVKANARIMLSRLEDTESNLGEQLLSRLEDSSVHSLKPIEEIQSHLQCSNLLSSPRDCPLVNDELPLQMPFMPSPERLALVSKAIKPKTSQKSKLKAKHHSLLKLKKNSKRHRRLKLKNRLKRKGRKRVNVSVQTDAVDIYRSNFFAPIPHTLLNSANGPARSLIDEFGRPILASAAEPTTVSLPAPPSDKSEAVRTSCATSVCTNTPPIQSNAPSNRLRKTFTINQTVPSIGKAKKTLIKGDSFCSKIESFSSPTKMSIIVPTASSSTVTQAVVVKVVKTPSQSEPAPSVEPVILPRPVEQPATCTVNGSPHLFTFKTIAGQSIFAPNVNLQQTITVPVSNGIEKTVTLQPQVQNLQNMSTYTIPISTGIHNANGKLVAHKFLIPVRNLNNLNNLSNLELMSLNSNRLPLLAPNNQSTIPNVIIVRPQAGGTTTVTVPDKVAISKNQRRIWTTSREREKPVYEWRKTGQKKSTTQTVPAQKLGHKSSNSRSSSTPPTNFCISVIDQGSRASVNGPQTPTDLSLAALANSNSSFASGSSANQNAPVEKTMQSVQNNTTFSDIVKRRVSTSDLTSLDSVVTSVPLRPLSEPVDLSVTVQDLSTNIRTEQSGPSGSILNKMNSTTTAQNVTSSPKLRDTLDSSISDAVRFSLMFADDGTETEGIESQVGIPNYNTYQEQEGYMQPATPTTFTEPENMVDTSNLFNSQSTSFESPQRNTFPEASSRGKTSWKGNRTQYAHRQSKKESEKSTKAKVKAILEEIKKKKKSETAKKEKDGSTSPGAPPRCYCETCGRGFVSTYNLKRHYKNVHKIDMGSPKSPRDGLNFNLSSPELPFSPGSDTPISPPCSSNVEPPLFLPKTPPQLPVSPKPSRPEQPFGHVTAKKVQYSWPQTTALGCSEDYPNTYSIPEFYADELPPVGHKPIHPHVQPLLPSESVDSQSMQNAHRAADGHVPGCFISESNDDGPFPLQQNMNTAELIKAVETTVSNPTTDTSFATSISCEEPRMTVSNQTTDTSFASATICKESRTMVSNQTVDTSFADSATCEEPRTMVSNQTMNTRFSDSATCEEPRTTVSNQTADTSFAASAMCDEPRLTVSNQTMDTNFASSAPCREPRTTVSNQTTDTSFAVATICKEPRTMVSNQTVDTSFVDSAMCEEPRTTVSSQTTDRSFAVGAMCEEPQLTFRNQTLDTSFDGSATCREPHFESEHYNFMTTDAAKEEMCATDPIPTAMCNNIQVSFPVICNPNVVSETEPCSASQSAIISDSVHVVQQDDCKTEQYASLVFENAKDTNEGQTECLTIPNRNEMEVGKPRSGEDSFEKGSEESRTTNAENSFQMETENCTNQCVKEEIDSGICKNMNGVKVLKDTSGHSEDNESLQECRSESEKITEDAAKTHEQDSPVVPENLTMGRTRSRDGKHHPKRFCPCCEDDAPLVTKKCRKNSGSSVGSVSCAKTSKGHSSRQPAKPKKGGRKAAKMPTRSSQKLRSRSGVP